MKNGRKLKIYVIFKVNKLVRPAITLVIILVNKKGKPFSQNFKAQLKVLFTSQPEWRTRKYHPLDLCRHRLL